jgi:RNA polymerase sigma-70 factor (ECF subfamily)
MFTIAANKARDALRKRSRRRELSLDAPIRRGDDGDSFVELLDGGALDAAHGLAAAEQTRVVDRAIEGLTPRQREVLLLAYYQRLSYQDISKMFSIPIGTVKSRLHSAVSAFARGIRAEVGDDGSENVERA